MGLRLRFTLLGSVWLLGLWVWLFYWRFGFGSLLEIDFAGDLYFCDCWVLFSFEDCYVFCMFGCLENARRETKILIF